jgi:glycerol-3-phosphate dehydrogenase
MGEELGWNATRKETEFDQAIYFLRSMGLPEGTNLKWSEVRNQGTKTFLGLKPDEAALYSRAQFTPDEVTSLRSQFEHMDFDHDQKITRADLINAMKQMGYESSTETADSILREVDFGRKGYIEFQEYLDIAAGLKELRLESAFTHLAQLDSTRKISEGKIGSHAEDSDAERSTRRKIPVERSGGGT